MAELSQNAALRHAIEKKTGERSEELINLASVNSRRARLLMQSGNPSAWQEGAKVAELAGPQKKPSNMSILSGFIGSEVKRLVKGQEVVEENVLSKRLKACESCPHLEEAPDTKLYHLGRRILRPDGDKICGLCGCFVSEKAKRKAEGCPASMTGTSLLSRWGEPIEKVEYKLLE
ncbi:hypothetical protein [uncultured Cohaesibacter sp.]|uniref:hypothetical protein n=1 Tax=uncultured Cohaesibacter sp. TaxID=1002546 RepID=UPI0029C71D5E|nr:hypothetical protein [uncultured Cohaesibacter sp.]